MSIKIGPCVIDRRQPELSGEERDLVDRFHELYYRRWRAHGDTINLSWFGHLLWKCPLDLWMYQELLVRTKPDFIVETGTFSGGSAYYLASILDLIGHGQIISIDLKPQPRLPEHPRISYITGSSIDAAIVEEVSSRVKRARAMVILDSDHHENHVYQELLAYSPLVQLGDYLIVEDTNVNGHPAFPDYGPGPMEALHRFLAGCDEFEIDQNANRFLMTLNPQGYLKRVKPISSQAHVASETAGNPHGKPSLSVVVVAYNIPREAPRTLFSLSAGYQRHISAGDYEVIVVDNGSTPPLDPAILDSLDGNFQIIRIDAASPSPAAAINRGLREARGDVIGVMIDGARIVTPGLLHFARQGALIYPRAVVASLGWYLGSDVQRWSVEGGYTEEHEDALLRAIDWPRDGYRLFEIATADESSKDGWVHNIAESNALFLSREMWDLIGGVDEQFDYPGGGLLNPDTLKRALEVPGSELVRLLGEGTFHQVHGGVATNSKLESFMESIELWHAQYARLRGERFQSFAPRRPPTNIGTLPTQVLFRLVTSTLQPIYRGDPPLGKLFDRGRWSLTKIEAPVSPEAAALVEIAQKEFNGGNLEGAVAVARLARSRFPEEHEPQRLLALVGPALVRRQPPTDRADFHVALGQAYNVLGDSDRSEVEFRAAIALDNQSPHAYVGLARLRMPGDGYLSWLARLHSVLTPVSYVEIGVNQGLSLALARSPTCAIGVDPDANLTVKFQTRTHLFPETSDEFFAHGRLRTLLGDEPLHLAFIDGLHLFEQALLDFIHLEAHCASHSFILLHDTLPLDEPTQERVRRTTFYTGDVWKVIPCLKQYRPDLDVFTIATPWSGLTVVSNLNPRSRVLSDDYSSVVEQFMELPFSEVENDRERVLNVVPNDWELLASRFTRRRTADESLQ